MGLFQQNHNLINLAKRIRDWYLSTKKSWKKPKPVYFSVTRARNPGDSRYGMPSVTD
jgi:hypothetical protein